MLLENRELSPRISLDFVFFSSRDIEFASSLLFTLQPTLIRLPVILMKLMNQMGPLLSSPFSMIQSALSNMVATRRIWPLKEIQFLRHGSHLHEAITAGTSFGQCYLSPPKPILL